MTEKYHAETVTEIDETSDITEPAKGSKERLYDKLPVTKRMMDVICLVLVAATVGVLLYGIVTGNM